MNALKRMTWSSSTNDLHQHLSAPLMPGSTGHSPGSRQSSPHQSPFGAVGGPWSGSNGHGNGWGGIGNGIGPRSPRLSPGFMSPYHSSSFNGYPFPDVRSPSDSTQQGAAGPRLDRAALHRSLSAWSTLLAALDEYRLACSTLASAQKTLAKALKEMAAQFGEKVEVGSRNEAVAAGLLATVKLFDSLQEVDQKHAKSVQREYEALNSLSATFFKKIAREEKNLEESLTGLDGKMAKVSASYERSRPIGNHRHPNSLNDVHGAAAAHEKYIRTLSALSNSVTGAKITHAENTGDKRDRAALEVVKGLCVLGEAAWRNRVDGTRKSGAKVGDVVLTGAFCEQNMPPLSAVNANGFDPLAVGIGAVGSLEVSEERVGLRANRHRFESEGSQATSSASADLSSPTNAPLSSPVPSSQTNLSEERIHRSLPHAPAASNSDRFDENLGVRSERSSIPNLPPLQPPSNQLHLPPMPQERHSSAYQHPSSTAPPSPMPNDDCITRNEVTRESSQIAPQPQQPEAPATRPPAVEHAASTEPTPVSPIQRPVATRWTSATSNHEQKYPLPAPIPTRAQIESPMDPHELIRRAVPATHAPLPPLEQARQPVSRPPLTRNESTSSERSFVAKMRAKYIEEKDRTRQAGSLERGYTRQAGSPSTTSGFPTSNHPRSSSRVSQIAQRYIDGAAASTPSSRCETTQV
ncbi:BQ2448_7625 [Microbotryum intermedium]|uniref:BQ2448_7625 protein n=1 Tax=Microbotryum intermedium TaxID=269621 RepID=A0A238FU47_9BASI|nr:BQ2448_7625 [Microbotryum intermedium]